MDDLQPAPRSPSNGGVQYSQSAPMILGPLRKNPRGAVLDLQSRLYDKPENCQVLQTIKKQEQMRTQQTTQNEQSDMASSFTVSRS